MKEIPDVMEPKHILDDPNRLWMADEWTKEREREAKERLAEQGPNAPTFWTNKYIHEAHRYWTEFYKRNKDNFYKDRHYLHLVFPELAPEAACNAETPVSSGKDMYLLEVGCGAGNAVFPLLEINPSLHVHAFDCAPSAVALVQAHIDEMEITERMEASVCDLVREDPPVTPRTMDFVLCMYVISAIAPEHHAQCFSKLASCLRPGGRLLLRDYALYDEAQLRFKKGSKLFDNFYVRQDGTCAYYFSEEDIARLATGAGLRVVENKYIRKQQANRAQKTARHRIFIQTVLEAP